MILAFETKTAGFVPFSGGDARFVFNFKTKRLFKKVSVTTA